jgi:hypothetical protein
MYLCQIFDKGVPANIIKYDLKMYISVAFVVSRDSSAG